MTLKSIDQISVIIKDNASKSELDLLKKKSETLKAHVTGIGAKQLISQIQGFERKSVMDQRLKMFMNNVDIVHRVLMPRDKVYNAKGGIEMYNLSTQRQKSQFKEFLGACATDNMSLKEYIRCVLQKKFDYDPMGLKWVEINEAGNPYPCYKSIHKIFEWQLNGRKPEFVIFNINEKEKKSYLIAGIVKGDYKDKTIYRVVCDTYDRLVVDGSNADNGYEIIAEIGNPFGLVPGEIISNIPGDEDYTCYESSVYPLVDLLSNYMFQRSVFNIAYARTAYPKEWMNKFTCPTCAGKKLVNNETCPECKGLGVLPAQQNSDTLIVEYANDSNKNIPVPPMGAIHSPIENLEFMKDNNISIEELLFYTKWGMFRSMPGTSTKTQAIKGGNVSNTAYEAGLNDQPKRDVLRKDSSWSASSIKWYADIMGSYIYGANYISSAILLGDRYMEETADATYARLLAARQAGASKSELDSITIEYFENKYQNNPLLFRKAYMLFLAEPFYHDDVSIVLTFNIPDIQKLEKIYFDEWVSTLTDIYFAGIPDNGGIFIMQKDLRDFVLGKYKDGVDGDATLYLNTGQMLNVGDNVQVKEQKALQPAHLGKTFKVTAAGDKFLTLEDENGGIFPGYKMTDLTKVNNNVIRSAAS